MKPLDHYPASFAQKWVWEKPRQRSTIRTILLVVVTGLLFLCAVSIIAALWVSTDLGNGNSSAGTDLQKKIYWHSSIKSSGYE